jgi:hypothetical protein
MRMAPLHVKRKFWWELAFIGLLLFLLTGVWAQRKATMVVAVPAMLSPALKVGAVVTPLSPALALK